MTLLKGLSRLALLAALPAMALILTSSPGFAAKAVTIKLATLAPDGSAWHKAVKEMGSEWRSQTDGRVKLRIYPGGVAGDDPDLVRKMRIGQLQAGAVTVAGLAAIDPAFNVFSIPLFYDSYDEFFYVREKLTPLLKDRLEEKGFLLLHWGHGGWVHIFSMDPVRTVDDLKNVKMFTWAGDDRMVQVWKANGFRPVALSATDILMGLETGMIDGVPTTPLAALSLQWFRHTPYMTNTGIAPLVGATIMSKKGWKKIPETDREVILEVAEEAARRLSSEIPAKDSSAVEEMQKRGLEVVEASAQTTWRETADFFANEMKGALIPEDVFNLALTYRNEFRADRGTEDSR